jgi:hypothetical protein
MRPLRRDLTHAAERRREARQEGLDRVKERTMTLRTQKLLALVVTVVAGIATSCGGETPGGGSLSVTISSPSATVHTAAALPVQVTVTGAPDVVELHRDGTLLVDLTPPYTYLWATAGEPEGSYVLTAVARRGATQAVSDPRTVVVDRTRPSVVDRTPVPNDDNVWLGDPITVTFSEPVRAATLTPGTVALERVGGAPVAATLVLSADGRSVTVVPDDAIDVPAELRLTLSDAIADLAGNVLVAPTPWTWTLPRWQWVGGTPLRVVEDFSVRHARLTVGPDGQPAAVWLEERGGTVPPSDVQAARWTGDAWDGLGGRLNGDDRVGPMYGYQDVAVASDGSVFVAWNTPVSGVPDRLWVHRWDGSTWQPVGGGPVNGSADDGSHFNVSLALDAADRPVVAWGARPDGWYPLREVRVTRWTGGAWVDVGTPRRRDPAHPTDGPVVALDGDDNPVVAWSERDGDSDRYDVFVDRWNGSAWISLGGSLRGGWGTAFAEDLAVGPGGEIVVAYSVASGEERRVAAARWSAGASAWTALGTLRGTSTSAAQNARVAIDPAGRTLLAWSESVPDGHGGTAANYFVQRRETAVWRDLGFPGDTGAAAGARGGLAVNASGEVFVAVPWSDDEVSRDHLRVWRSNGVP